MGGDGGRPSSTRSSRGAGGSNVGKGFSREISLPSPREEGGVGFVAPPLTAPAKLADGSNKKPRSLMFTSAARKRGGGGEDAPAHGAASPLSSAAPPSPTGSALSGFSGFSAISGATAGDGDPARRSSVNLTLPPSVNSSSASCGAAHPVVSVVTVAARKSSSAYGRNPALPGGGGGGASSAAAATKTALTAAATASATATATAATTTAAKAAGIPNKPSPSLSSASGVDKVKVAALSPADVVAAAERLGSPSARERMRPPAAAVAELWTSLGALEPTRVGELGGAAQVVEAAGAASGAVQGASALMNVTEDVGGDCGAEKHVIDEEKAEAAGALLAEAGDAVETLAQVRFFFFVHIDVTTLFSFVFSLSLSGHTRIVLVHEVRSTSYCLFSRCRAKRVSSLPRRGPVSV